MAREFTPDELIAALDDYTARYAEIKQTCEAAVVEWRLGNCRMVDPRPLWDEVHRSGSSWSLPKRRWLAGADGESGERHGFDADGVLRIYERRHLFYQPELIDEINIFEGKKKVSVCLTRYVLGKDGQVQLVYNEITGSECDYFEEKYFYEQGRPVKSIQVMWQFADGKAEKWDYESVFRYHYDEEGHLDRVIEDNLASGNLRFSTLWFVRARGETIESASRDLEDFMVDQIPMAVIGFAADEPLFSVMICYCGEDIVSGWPGYLAIATESVRDEHLEKHPEDIWSPEEWWSDSWVDLSDAAAKLEMQERGLRLFQLLDDPDEFLSADSLRPLLHRAARRLNEVDWQKIVPVTDDFVVVVVDNTGENACHEDIGPCLTPERTKALRSSGFLEWMDS